MFVTSRAYQSLKDDYDTREWALKKRIHELEEKLKKGEQNRVNLEFANTCLIQDNAMLHQKKEDLAVSLADAEREIKELKMRIIGLEARRSR